MIIVGSTGRKRGIQMPTEALEEYLQLSTAFVIYLNSRSKNPGTFQRFWTVIPTAYYNWPF